MKSNFVKIGAAIIKVLITILTLLPLVLVGQPKVSNGVLELSGQDFNEVVELNGKWLFYEGLLTPDSIHLSPSAYIQVPSYWQVGPSHKGYGCGLYHLQVRGAKDELMALRLDRVHTSYAIWINDQLIHKSGNPSNEEETIPGIDNKPILFNAPGKDFEIYIGVSNYWHARGGIIKQVEIGPANVLIGKWTKKLIWDLVFVSLILTISLYSLIMFWVGHRQLSYLYFSLFCFFTILRLISTESMIIGVIAPGISYYLITAFRYVAFFIGSTFVAIYCEKLMPNIDGHWVVKLLKGTALFCSAGVLLAPSWIGSYFFMIFQAILMLAFILFYPITLKEIRKDRRDLILIVLSITSMLITFLHDSLVVMRVLAPGFWQLYGLTISAIFQLSYFSLEYKSLNRKVGNLHSSLTSLGIIHREKSEFEKVLINDIKGQLAEGTQDEDFLRGVLKKINRGPSVPANQKVTIESIDKVSQDFLLKLKKKYPDLTQKETELCLSLKAKLSTKEIAVFRNMTTDSVKKARSRLRQKLNLEKETDLYQFFESF